MKVFVTKYALTQGIKEVEVEDCGNGMVRTPGFLSNGGGRCFHGEGREWHRTKEAAVERAEKMRVDKIKSLQKSIKKIQDLKWR